MQAVISFRARGRGAFALRKELKAKLGTYCDVRRSPANEFGTSLHHQDKFQPFLSPPKFVFGNICDVRQIAERNSNNLKTLSSDLHHVIPYTVIRLELCSDTRSQR